MVFFPRILSPNPKKNTKISPKMPPALGWAAKKADQLRRATPTRAVLGSDRMAAMAWHHQKMATRIDATRLVDWTKMMV
jgi:hypothetical protein